jgi:predicted signal transduction protein with EAL and GGDEF domain
VERAHIVSRAAYAGLVALVIGFLAFAIGAAFVTKDAARVEAQAAQRSDLFSAARFEVGAEQSLHRSYQLERTQETLLLHAQAARRLVDNLVTVRALSDPRTGAIVDRLLVAHNHYLTATHILFAAVDRRGTARARAIDHLIVDPVFVTIQTTVNDEARRLTQLARTARATLRNTEDFIIVLTIVVSLIAIIVLSIILTVLRHYKQQVDATIRSEMDHLKKAALTDYLTGLGNHRAYQEDLHRLTSDRTNQSSLTIALIDVDEFKALNDREGHAAGDRVLTSLARLLRSTCVAARPYRLGLQPSVARQSVERLRVAIEAELGGTTVSIGVATTDRAKSDLMLLRDEAGTALYEAKRRGRNTVVMFDEIREEAAMFLPARVAEVRDLIDGSGMGVAFQPIWDLGARRVIGYEALARPAGDNPINPQDAFDIAERLGKAHDLDRICRNAVLENARMLPPKALLFINVSPQSLDHEEFRGTTLVDAVVAVGFTPDRVVLEITERSLARLPVVVREAKRLRALGFALALDDAGSGNSGLEMLSQLAVDFVKIDREVIVRAQSDVGGRAVLAGIIAIAQEMRAQIIAEGIEDAAMLDLVRNATRWSTISSAVQGYYLGRPSENFVDAAALSSVEQLLAQNAEVETITPAPSETGRMSPNNLPDGRRESEYFQAAAL